MTIREWLNLVLRRRPTPPSPPPPPPSPWLEPTQDQQQLLALTNGARERYNLPALRLEPRLCQSARRVAELCAASGRLDHFISGTPQERMAAVGYRPLAYSGECLAAGQSTPQQVIDDWVSDPPHQAIVLGHFADVGFGRAGNVWAADFGTLA